MIHLSWKEVWARRLARHHLLQPAPAGRLAEVVGAVCGIQAQVMPAAELAVGVRVAGATRRDVQAALWDERSLVKTYGLRGTVHLFPAAELPLWMAALRTNSAGNAKRLERMGLDSTQLDLLVEAIGGALDGQCLTLRRLGDDLVARLGPWAAETASPAWGGKWPRWRMALGAAAVAGQLCYGPPEGNEVTFVRPDQWIGGWSDQDASAALVEVFRRYLRAYGPATHRDFAQWFNMPPGEARKMVTALRDELVEVDVEGYRALLMADDAEVPTSPWEASVCLLPHFDCYVIGCHPRARLVPAAWTARVPPRTIPSQLPELLIDGVIGGIWQYEARGRRVEVRIEPVVALDRQREDQLAVQAGRVGEFLEGEASLTIGPIVARPHL